MFALISPVCTNPIGPHHLLYHRFGKMSMYKLYKILQRFLCRIPIDSKQGAPGPPTRLCATMCVYLYPYPGALPYPTPCLPTYIHVYIIVYVCDDVCVYLIVFVFALFSLLLSLFLSLFSLFFFSYPRRACGKACPWAGAAGFISLVYTSVLFYLIIIQ